jgi:methionine aminotransferase
VHQFAVFSVHAPVQYALAEFMQNKENYNISGFYQAKRDLFRELVAESKFKVLPCSGGYFQLLDYSEITAEKDLDFAMRLVAEHGIAAIPVSVFYNSPEYNQVLRFCFAKNNETLEKACAILRGL